MFGVIAVFHALICIMLVVIILMQSGRGGGLTEGFAAAESLFGAKTNTVLVKGTSILATLFIMTCLSLAFMSSHKDKSLLSDAMLNTTSNASPQKSSNALPAAPTEDPESSTTQQTTQQENASQPQPADQPVPAPVSP